MLHELSINNFAIADQLDIEFEGGLSTITGETGAGKSIMIDALSLALGARADSHWVGSKSNKTQIIANFDITTNPQAKAWLEERSLDADGECILRRVLSKDGKSRAFINGTPSPLQDVKALSEHLINIHSQHQHQQLLKKESHRELIDAFCEEPKLLDKIKQTFKEWKTTEKELSKLKSEQNTRLSRIEFLDFQLNELDQLAIEDGEYKQLSEEHRSLANADQDIESAQSTLAILRDGETSALDLLAKSQGQLEELSQQHPKLKPAAESIASALIQTEESSHDIQHYIDSLELDPERLHNMDQRLSTIHDLARKHNVSPDELFQFHQSLTEELSRLKNSDSSIAELEEACGELEKSFKEVAQKLSKKRKQMANKLDKQVNHRFAELGMEGASILTEVESLDINEAKPYGLDRIEICVSTNPGQKHQSLAKIASGGELSRISLAIQVCFAEKASLPCLIFDEVDVGIGGATAEVVGRLLKELADHGQVICVTHLAQVAAQGQQHFKVQKDGDDKSRQTQVNALSQKERINEISRMLGGLELTQKTQSHAKEMLAMAKAS